MNCPLYSIFDVKAKHYGMPMSFYNDATAVRFFSNLIKKPDTVYHDSPDDFSFFRIADLNSETGLIVSDLGTIVLLATGSELKIKP